jgi:hypothetical protein
MGGLLMRRTAVVVVLALLVTGASARIATAKTKSDPAKEACLQLGIVYNGTNRGNVSRVAASTLSSGALSIFFKIGRYKKLSLLVRVFLADDTNQQALDRLQNWCTSHYPKVHKIVSAALIARTTTTTMPPPTTTLAVGSGQLLLTALQSCASHEGSASVPGCLAEYSAQATADPGTPPNSALETALTYPFNASDLDASPAGVGTQGAAWCSDPANVDALRTAARTDPLPLAVLQQVATSLHSSVQELVCQRATLTQATTPTTHSAAVVTYEVTGDGSADLTTTNASGGTEQKTVNLPYSEQLDPPPDGLVYLSAQLNGSGSISCKISYGGQVIQEASSQGDYVIASCSGSI